MANRRTDPERIQQALSRLEDMLVDRYTDTRADLRQAAIAPRRGRQNDPPPASLPAPGRRQPRPAGAGMGPNSGDEG
jgi:hypothetical protein